MCHSGGYKNSTGLILAGLTVFLLGINGAVAQAAAGSPGCATRDVEVIILIEDHGAANDVAPERLYKAGLAQMDARIACSKGRVAEAITLYDDIIQSLGPILSRSTR
jgi:hypothetical protein